MIGTVFAWILGLGVLFLSIFIVEARAAPTGPRRCASCSARSSASAPADARLARAIALGACPRRCWRSRGRCCSPRSTPRSPAALRRPGREPSASPSSSLLGVVAAEATQAVGALLLLGLLAAPAGAARLLTTALGSGLALSGALAIGAIWGGLALSYSVSSVPPSSAVIGIATCAYLVAVIARRIRERGDARAPRVAASPNAITASSDG